MKKITLILLLAVMTASLAACGGKKCEHTYANACDVTCNECGEERTITHTWNDATCIAPKTCKICGATDGDALGHTPNADDGDCTTPVTCSVCEALTVMAKTHNFTDEWIADLNEYGFVCTNDGCAATITLGGQQIGTTHEPPLYTVPTDIVIYVGQSVCDAELPEGWSWHPELTEDPLYFGIDDIGSHTLKAIFTTTDTDGCETVEADINIVCLARLSEATVSVNDQSYTGFALTPDVTVTAYGKTLVKDVDYSVSYVNNKNPGTATVIITGISGRCEGEITASFKITAEIPGYIVDIDPDDYQ